MLRGLVQFQGASHPCRSVRWLKLPVKWVCLNDCRDRQGLWNGVMQPLPPLHTQLPPGFACCWRQRISTTDAEYVMLLLLRS
jgi:hypothetical protein